MHVSLDSALGRQRRLNSVGESVLQIAPNAAAAYSLRSLTGGSPKVVRVRRASDNGERDFTSAEINSGEMVSWVNQQAIAPLDIQALEADGRTGDFLIAKAAYSLRSLGTRQATLAATGDTVARADGKFVAQVRRNVNGDLKSFTADEVTDGTLLSFVNESFTSSLPLDVAGSAAAAYGLRNLSSSYSSNVVEIRRSSDDTTQNFKAAEITDGTLRNFCLNDDADIISFADAGLAGSPAANKRMYFDGVNDNVESNTTVDESSDFFVKTNVVWLGNRDEVIFSDRGSSERLVNVQVHSVSDKVRVQVQTSTGFSVPITSTSDLPKFQVVEVMLQHTASTKTLELFFDGVLQGSGNYTGTSTPANRSTVEIGSENGGRPFNGIISDFNYNNETIQLGYGNTNTDWEDTVGSNNGTVEGSPVLFTGQGFDGFVKTWYDQSGNSNDAAQATAASQPKIVSAGVLLVDGNGKPEINFTKANEQFLTASSAISCNDILFTFRRTDTTTGLNGLLTEGGSTSPFTYVHQSNTNFSFDGNASNTANVGFDGQFYASSSSDLTGVVTVAQHLAYINYTNTAGSISDIGRLNNGAFNYGTFGASELIFYASSQLDKRRAMEESVAGHYGITLASFNRDGFVKTQYDQSVTNEAGDTATGNHATQATAASQPKIVSAGSLLTDGIDFDGTDDKLATTSAISSTNVAIVSVSKSDVNATGAIFSMLDGFNDGHEVLYLANNVRYALEDSDLDVSSTPTNKNLYFANYDGSTQAISINGTNNTQSVSKTVDTITSVSQIGSRQGANLLNGSIEELIVYTSDQSANRTALEANIGETYSITGIPAYDNEVDGFVETWYDQSGNSNDSTQATASLQPKIVSAGALVTDSNNNPEIDFNGSNYFGFVNTTDSSSPYTVSSVSSVRDTGTHVIYGLDTGTTSGFYRQTGTSHGIYSGGTVTGSGFAINTDYLRFDLFNGSSSVIGVNGDTTNVALASDRTNTGFRIAFSGINTGQSIDGTIKEIILYQSDQTDNRTAIEANINSQYSIF